MYPEYECDEFKHNDGTVQKSKSLIQLEMFHQVRDQNMQRFICDVIRQKWRLDSLHIIHPKLVMKLYLDIKVVLLLFSYEGLKKTEIGIHFGGRQNSMALVRNAKAIAKAANPAPELWRLLTAGFNNNNFCS